MILTDPEILELNGLCSAVVDETLTEAQRVRLTDWLKTSEAARQYYVRALAQSASLHRYASEMQTDAPERGGLRLRQIPPTVWWSSVLTAAAVLFLVFWFGGVPGGRLIVNEPSAYVARMTGSKDAQWAAGSPALHPGDHVRRGQRLELERGFAEITYDSGAQVMLEGPASLDINSAWDSTLHRGAIKASVPPEALGFRISNSAVEVVDLGTEFSMVADANGDAEVLVLKGEVEASPRSGADQDTFLLRQNEARRFAQNGTSKVSDGDQQFARLIAAVPLDRLSRLTHYIHWSFDEAEGNRLKADRLGAPLEAFDAQIEASTPEGLAEAHPMGRREHALRFDGALYAKAHFPGISESITHTLAFWVKVPRDAQLSDSYAMVAWGTNSHKLGARPVQISWNRNPTEGSIGAVRTDFGGGCAIGMSSLRDGRWHHVTVVFAPGIRDDTPVEVKQYVDGRLESGTIIPGKVRAPARTIGQGQELGDTLWLGCRLGTYSLKPERFRGEIDELFVADRGLDPSEIVQLMRDNRPPETSSLAFAVVTEPELSHSDKSL